MKKVFVKKINVLLGFLGVLLVRVYQLLLSPLIGGNCRFEPSCSQYAVEVFQKQSSWYAFTLIFKRLMKCQPWGQHGYDPAPDKPIIRERSFHS